MANPWDDYAVADAPAQAAPAAPAMPGALPEEVEEPVGEMIVPPAAAAPVAGEPWTEFSTPEEDGIVGGVTDTGEGYAEEQEPEPPREAVGAGSAAWSGLKSGALMGFDDELQAGAGAVGNVIGSTLGLNNSTASLAEIYAKLVAEARGQKDNAYEDSPIAYGAGYVPGALMSAFLTRGRGPASGTLMGKLGQGAMEGMRQGAITGAGNAGSGVEDTLAGAVEGGAWGAPLGALAVPVGMAVGNVAGRVGRAVRPTSSAENGLDALALRAPQSADDITRMRGEVDRFEQAGVPARLVDVVDERGRGVIRDAAGKMDGGRDVVSRHADDVYSSMQDRVAQQARDVIDPNPQTSRQLERQIRGDAKLGGEDDAGVLMGQQMEPLRGRVIQVDDDMKAVLGTREGQAALRAAEGLMTEPADRAAARKLMAAAKEHAKGPVDVDALLRKEVPGWDDMPDVIKQAYLKERPDLAEVGDAFAETPLTLDLADKFARAMRGRAAKTPGLERVARDFSNTVRQSARNQVPEYDEALTTYAASQRVADAAEGTAGTRYENSGFMSAPADTYREVVGGAAATPPVEGGVSEVQALARRARDEIADTARSKGGQNAPGVARTIARGSAQQERSTALLGPERAGRLQQGMEAEVNRLDNTRFIDSRVGSQSTPRAMDAIVDGFGEAVANAATGGKWGVIRTAGKWLKQGGIKGVDAERLARDSISEDPARVRAAIDYLEQKGMKRERAERFVGFYGSALAGRAGGAAVDDEQ